MDETTKLDAAPVEETAGQTVAATPAPPTRVLPDGGAPAAGTDTEQATDWTTEQTTARPWPVEPDPFVVPPAPRPRSVAAAEPTQPASAAWDALARSVRRLRVAVIVLGCVVALLVGSVALLATGAWGPGDGAGAAAASDATGGASDGSTAGGADRDDAVDAGKDADKDAGKDSAKDPDKDADAAGDVDLDAIEPLDPDEPLRAALIVEIVGEKWSNAQRILDALEVDQNDLVLITDDGGQVFDPANWTVTLVADLEDSGKVAVHLRHDIDWPW